MPEPKFAAKLLLENEWDASNTSIGSAPSIHTGKYDQSAEEPQVTVTTTSETVLGGGETGISFIQGGGGLGQDIDGFVQVNARSDRDAASTNPKKLTREFAEEIRRILLETGTDIAGKLAGTTLAGTELVHMTPQGPPTELPPETDRSPTVFAFVVEAGYYYQATA